MAGIGKDGVWRFSRQYEHEQNDEFVEQRATLEARARRAIAAHRKSREEQGRIFLELKKTVRHGMWQPYYEKTFGDSGLSFRSAQRFMRRAERADKNDRPSFLKTGDDAHATASRHVTEAMKKVLVMPKAQTESYRLSLNLAPDLKTKVMVLWASPKRPAAEGELIPRLAEIVQKYDESES